MPKDFNFSDPPYNNESGKEGALPVYDVTPFTMLDFPEKCAAIVWFSGCNMRCGYCHNPQIVKGKGRWHMDDVLAFLEKRKSVLDGIVLSGGEATIYPAFLNFVHRVKEMGYAIKLDTNGTRPNILQNLLSAELLDYVALDYKAPPEKYKVVTGIYKFENFKKTLDLLCKQSAVPFEIRTTVHTFLMDEQDVLFIMNDLNERNYTGTYYVQNYINNGGPTLGMLLPQKRTLDLKTFPKNNTFLLEFRNF